MYQINTQASIDKPTITGTIPVLDWLTKIKEGYLIDKINEARSIEDSAEYKKFKSENLPCVNYNALFDRYKADRNITASTGLLYMDFDDPRFDISLLDKSKIYSYYTSLSGHSYAVLVKVEGLTKVNYKDTVLSICTELGGLDYLDPNSLRISQSNVISYDPNLFLNLDSYTFKATNFTPVSFTNKRSKGYSDKERGKIRFHNLGDYEEEGKDYVVNFEQGFEYIKCHIPFKTKKGKRNDVLLSYCNNLVWLNPFISKSECFNILSAVNVRAFEAPVEEARLHKVMGSIFRYLEEGTLKPLIFKKNRKVSFSDTCTLSRSEKLTICRVEYGKYRTEKVKNTLRDIILKWNIESQGKVTIQKIQDMKLIGKDSVDKYYKENKDLVAEVNKKYYLYKKNKL